MLLGNVLEKIYNLIFITPIQSVPCKGIKT